MISKELKNHVRLFSKHSIVLVAEVFVGRLQVIQNMLENRQINDGADCIPYNPVLHS